MKTLLIVENNIDFAYVIEWHFQQQGMNVYSATNAEKALKIYKEHSPDILLLDINIDGDIDGKDFARTIRKTDKYTSIIFMSGESKSPTDVVEGLNIGCNFFLKKPVSIEEIDAHVKIALNTKTEKPIYKMSGVVFNLDSRTLSFAGKQEYLSDKEIKVLQILADYKNTIVKHETFFDKIWEGEFADESLRNNISSIRKKIKNTKLKIDTIKNKGYKLNTN